MVEPDIVLLAIALEEEENVQRKKRKYWVDDLWQKICQIGEFHTLHCDLRFNPRKFYDYYRMDIEKYENLVNLLRPHILKNNTNFRCSISAEERVSISLRYLTTAINFKSMSFDFRVGYTTAHSIVHETCKAIWKVLGPMVLPNPTEEMWKAIEKDFKEIWNFPNCIGAMDGKHVNIRAPHNSGSAYYNYKKFFSTVLLAIVDAKYRFIIVDVGAYGRNSDGGILMNSKFGQRLQNRTLNIPPNKFLPGTTDEMPHVFVADEAFPLSQNIMRPYSGNQLPGNQDKRVFNYRLSRARQIVENAFGILQNKFEVFQKKLRIQPKYLDYVILACLCLHNYVIDDVSTNKCTNNMSPLQNSILENIATPENRNNEGQVMDGLITREKFKNYFNSENGSVHWQNDLVNRC